VVVMKGVQGVRACVRAHVCVFACMSECVYMIAACVLEQELASFFPAPGVYFDSSSRRITNCKSPCSCGGA
jgi:hypothetical protein